MSFKPKQQTQAPTDPLDIQNRPASLGGASYDLPPENEYAAYIVGVAYFGWQKTEYKGEPKDVEMSYVYFGWTDPTTGAHWTQGRGVPLPQSRNPHPNSWIAKVTKAVGRVEPVGNIKELLGESCRIAVAHYTQERNGFENQRAKIEAVLKLLPGQEPNLDPDTWRFARHAYDFCQREGHPLYLCDGLKVEDKPQPEVSHRR